MIEHLRGTLITREPGHLVVDCAGVGYGLEVPHSTLQALPQVGSEVRLHVHFQMRESEIALCGFATEEERALFRALVGVQSIGPKMGLAMLSTLSVDDLVHAILDEDVTLLTSISGIGKRTAERLVVELREPLRKMDLRPARRTVAAASEDTEAVPAVGVTREMRDAAVAALVELGTKPAVAARAVTKAAKALTEQPSVEALVKEGLRLRQLT
jgi:Holliday junction DNA helicase RuvA